MIMNEEKCYTRHRTFTRGFGFNVPITTASFYVLNHLTQTNGDVSKEFTAGGESPRIPIFVYLSSLTGFILHT